MDTQVSDSQGTLDMTYIAELLRTISAVPALIAFSALATALSHRRGS